MILNPFGIGPETRELREFANGDVIPMLEISEGFDLQRIRLLVSPEALDFLEGLDLLFRICRRRRCRSATPEYEASERSRPQRRHQLLELLGRQAPAARRPPSINNFRRLYSPWPPAASTGAHAVSNTAADRAGIGDSHDTHKRRDGPRPVDFLRRTNPKAYPTVLSVACAGEDSNTSLGSVSY